MSRAARGHPGVIVRHAKDCPSRTGGTCRKPCRPAFVAWVWDRRTKKKLYRQFETLAAARAWRADATSALGRGELRTTTTLTLREAAEAWLEAAERGEILSRYRRPYKPSALRGYRADLERYVLPDLGARRLSDITADDLQALVDRLVGSGLSGSKTRNVVTPLQSLYRRHRRQVLVDPTDGLDLPAAGGRRERVAPPSEADRLLAALPQEDAALWAVAFYAGLRRGELRALRCEDVEDGVIRVRRSWDDYAGEVDPKSTAGIRDVPVPDTLRRILARHLERTGRRGADLVFGRTATEPFTPGHIADRADAAWTAAGAPRVTLHECRHSYSTYLDAAGISETRSDRYMGHSNPSVANRYRHALAGQLAEDAARLDEYLTGAAAGKVVPLPTGTPTGTAAVQMAQLSQMA